MITIDEIKELGWEMRWPGPPDKGMNSFRFGDDNGHHIMAISFKADKEDGFHDCSIAWVDRKVRVNEWENSDPCFHGGVKTKEDLQNIMRYCFIVEY